MICSVFFRLYKNISISMREPETLLHGISIGFDQPENTHSRFRACRFNNLKNSLTCYMQSINYQASLYSAVDWTDNYLATGTVFLTGSSKYA